MAIPHPDDREVAVAAMTRVLKLHHDGRLLDVPVRVFWPVRDAGGWSCRWAIEWPDRTRTNDAHGTDAVQALVHALQMIGAELYASDAHKAGKLTWDNGRQGYGFPVANAIRDLLVGDDMRFL